MFLSLRVVKIERFIRENVYLLFKMRLPQLYLVLLTIIALIFSGCVQERAEVKDCGSDMDCYMESFSKCEPAKVKPTDWGIIEYLEIKGWDSEGNCEVYTESEINKVDVT